MMLLGVGALGWYYAHVFAEQKRAVVVSRQAVQAKANGSAPLPPLGAFQRPSVVAVAGRPSGSLAAQLLGPPPVLPALGSSGGRGGADAAWRQAQALQGWAPPPAEGRVRESSRALQLQAALAGPVFSGVGGPAAVAPSASESSVPAVSGSPMPGPWVGAPWGEPAGRGRRLGSASRANALSALLRPTVTRTVQASVLPTQRLLLPKGAFIDCTLETAIDSTLPGMTTCVTATDTFSADGEVVLLGRGTQLVGETRGEVSQGQARVFVLWTEARTPSGVVVPLDSPATDALGRSGLSGTVNTHFWARFGAAILVSVIDAGAQVGVQSAGNGTVIVNPATSEDVMTGILQSTVNIPPTVSVAPGTRVQVLVARNVDFRSVYRLALVPHSAAAPVAQVHSAARVSHTAVFEAGGR
jgi:type IV secretion system protein VirB10